MVLSNSKACIIEYRILRSQSKVYKYSTVHSSRIEINSINSTVRNRLLLQLFISEMIHAKQWHYSLQQRLPEASFHSFYTKNPRNSSSTNSTSRRQKSSPSNSAEGKEIFYSVLQGHSSHSRHSSHS